MDLDQFLRQEYITTAIDFALKAVGALVVLIAAWVIAGWLKRTVESRLEKISFDQTLAKFFANIVR